MVKLEIFNTYNKANIDSNFIKFSKSFTSLLILFNLKIFNSFCLYIAYQKLNNFTIKNWYYYNLAKIKINIKY